MKTLEILTSDEALLAPKLKSLKLKELERHADKILLKKASASYKDVLGTIIKAMPKLEGDTQQKYQVVQAIVFGYFKNFNGSQEEAAKIVERLTVMLMVIIAKKFERIHKRQEA